MKHALLLAWRYVVHHRVRSVILSIGIGLTILLPLCVQLLVDRASDSLAARAENTPLVVGSPGSRYDLVLSSLYFRGRIPKPLTMAEVDRLRAGGLAEPIPVLARGRAGGWPLVGTTYDYFGFRGLLAEQGTLPLVLGDCVLGAEVAEDLGLGPGQRLLTDQDNLYSLAGAYPLNMRITGVLAARGTPDDRAVFCDLNTAWVVEGLAHGHQAAEEQGDAQVLARDGDRVVLNASVFEFNEITPENRHSFHVHAEPGDLPVTGILVRPRDSKSSTLLKGRYQVSDNAQLLVPTEVVTELLGFVFQVKRFFDANAILVGVATILFLSIIVLLSLQVRRREIETLTKIGCAQATVARILGLELLLVVLGGGLIAGLTSFLIFQFGGGAGILP